VRVSAVDDGTGQPTGLSGTQRDYGREARFWWQRWFLGRVNTRSAVLKLSLPSANLQATSVLIALSQESTRQAGEQFVTDATFQDVATPLFVIGPNTVIEGLYEMKVSYDVSSDAVGATLETVSQALTAFSPGADLLNDLTRDGVNEAASFIDQSVSNVLGQTLTERGHFSHSIDDWLNGQEAIVDIYLPEHATRRIAAITPGDIRKIGQWRIAFDLPRYSMMTPASDCTWGNDSKLDCRAVPATLEERADRMAGFVGALTAEQVLSYPLAENVTVSSQLRNETWFPPAQTTLREAVETQATAAATAAASPSPAAQSALDGADTAQQSAAETFCRQTLASADAMGLNGIDAHLTLWASLHMADIAPGARDAVLDNTACGRASDIISRMFG